MVEYSLLESHENFPNGFARLDPAMCVRDVLQADCAVDDWIHFAIVQQLEEKGKILFEPLRLAIPRGLNGIECYRFTVREPIPDFQAKEVQKDISALFLDGILESIGNEDPPVPCYPTPDPLLS